MEQFNAHIKSLYPVNVSQLYKGRENFYDWYNGEHAKYWTARIEDIYQEHFKDEVIPAEQRYLLLKVMGDHVEEGCEIKMPPVKYIFKPKAQ